MAVFIPDSVKGSRRLPTAGFHTVPFKVKIPTTALDSTDEQVLLCKFGPDTLFHGKSVNDLNMAFGVLDGVASLVFQVGFGDVDGVIDVTYDDSTELIAASTSGQAGAAYVPLDAIADDVAPCDISNKYLIFDVTTASATPASEYVSGYITVECGGDWTVDDSLV